MLSSGLVAILASAQSEFIGQSQSHKGPGLVRNPGFVPQTDVETVSVSISDQFIAQEKGIQEAVIRFEALLVQPACFSPYVKITKIITSADLNRNCSSCFAIWIQQIGFAI